MVGPGSGAAFDVVVDSEGAYPLVTHSLTGALRGAIAVLIAKPDADDPLESGGLGNQSAYEVIPF